MKMDIGEVFCELLSGLAIMFLLLPFLDLFKIRSISQSLEFISQHNGAAELAGALVAAYCLGLIMDAVGIAIGEKWLYPQLHKRVKEKEPCTYERKAFYEKTSAHLLQHREYEYAYLLAYTNLLIIAVPSVILWCAWTVKFGRSCAPFVIVSVFIFLEWSLWESIKFHLKQEVEITRAYVVTEADKLPKQGEDG